MRHFEPIRPLVHRKTRTWARDMYLMTWTVRGESRPSGLSSGKPNPMGYLPPLDSTLPDDLLVQPAAAPAVRGPRHRVVVEATELHDLLDVLAARLVGHREGHRVVEVRRAE